MSLAPLLLLLPLLPSLMDAASENHRPDFGVNQPEHLEAPEGGSIRIYCSFYHGWELAENPAVDIAWRWKGFHGDFIYNQTLNYTHKEFKDRLLVWTQGQTQGTLLIRNLRREDSTTYFCRVQLTTKSCGIQVLQSIPGTNLTVTAAASNVKMNQPAHLEAPMGGSVCINFSFYHGWELAENPAVSIAWRWKNILGDYIYNQTLNFTHKEFKDRLLLVWTQGQTHGALLIRNLRREDSTTYFCQVQLTTKSCGIRAFQSITGTLLTITPAQPEASLNVTNSTQSMGPPSLEAMVEVTVIVALIKITMLGVISYLVWKKSQG